MTAEPRPRPRLLCCRPRHPYLGACDEGNADGELAPHPPAQEPAPGVPLVLQTEDVQHAFDFFRALLARQAFQLTQQGTEIWQQLLTGGQPVQLALEWCCLRPSPGWILRPDTHPPAIGERLLGAGSVCWEAKGSHGCPGDPSM